MLTIQSRSHPYTVESFPNLREALKAAQLTGTLCLVDKIVYDKYRDAFEGLLPPEKIHTITATEEQKSFEELTPIFVWLLQNGLRRDGNLLVVGGGVLQDIGCFIASVLFRGVRWELIPTTLLSQCDSCIGSKSSINIRSYKNQIGTFYPPHRVLLTVSVLRSLPFDEIRSGLGEAIKLHLLTGEQEFETLMADLARLPADEVVLERAVASSLRIKQPYIEKDEWDKGIRNLLNYGHTFGHAYESATHYGIPHGISVTLGMLTATFVSSRLGLVDRDYYVRLKARLEPWYTPYNQKLKTVRLEDVLAAIKLDKKNTHNAVNCILTRGPGKMEKTAVDLETQLRPAIEEFIRGDM